jgi:hypothetical protein
MSGTWEIWLDDMMGMRLQLVKQHGGFEVASVLNERGTWSLALPFDINWNLIRKDWIVEFWRRPEGALMGRLEYVGFIRWWEIGQDAEQRTTITVGGWDFNDLLARGIAAHYAGSAQAAMSGYTGNLMRAVVRNELASGATDYASAARGFSRLSVEGDLDDGEDIDKKFSWRKVITVLQEMADISNEIGTPMWFGIAPVVASDQTLNAVFRARAFQWGMDRSLNSGNSTGIVFAPEFGNLAEPLLRYDYADEATVAYVGGNNTGTDRVIRTVISTRALDSIWNRREVFVDGRDTADPNVLDDRGREALSDVNLIQFSGRLVDTPGCRYGVDWDYGDLVTAQFGGLNFDVLIRSRRLAVNAEGVEELEVKVEG